MGSITTSEPGTFSACQRLDYPGPIPTTPRVQDADEAAWAECLPRGGAADRTQSGVQGFVEFDAPADLPEPVDTAMWTYQGTKEGLSQAVSEGIRRSHWQHDSARAIERERRKVTSELKALEVAILRGLGLTYREIADRMNQRHGTNMGKPGVYKYIKRAEKLLKAGQPLWPEGQEVEP